MLPLNTSDAILVDPQRLELWYHANRACVLAARRRVSNLVPGGGIDFLFVGQALCQLS